MEKCLKCQFYDRRNVRAADGRAATMSGPCRRHSPKLNPVSTKSHLVEGVWPIVRDDDWCGEWKAPPPTSISGARFEPRSDEFPTTVTLAVAEDHLVAAVSGDD